MDKNNLQIACSEIRERILALIEDHQEALEDESIQANQKAKDLTLKLLEGLNKIYRFFDWYEEKIEDYQYEQST